MNSKKFKSVKRELLDFIGVNEDVLDSLLSDKEEEELVKAYKNDDFRKRDALLSLFFWRFERVDEDHKRAQHWKNFTDLMKVKKQWKHKGEKLVSVLAIVSERLKQENAIQDYKVLPFNKKRPDLIMNKNIGIECKNWNPQDKNKMNSHNLKTKVIERFEGDKSWVKENIGTNGWKRKILVIPKLKYGYDPDKCKNLVKKHDIEVVDGFRYVSEDPKDFNSAQSDLYREFKKRKWKENSED